MDANSPPGFRRVEEPGQRVHYLTIPEGGRPSRKLSTKAHVREYLEKEGIHGVKLEDFDFKVKRKIAPTHTIPKKQERMSAVFDSSSDEEGERDVEEVCGEGSRFNLKNLVKSGVKLDHEKILEETATMLDTFRLQENEEEFEPARLAKLKIDLMNSSSLDDLVQTVGASPQGLQAMASVIEQHCLQELLLLSASEGPAPLSEWPNSMSENWFSEVVKLALRSSPITLSLILRLAVKDREANVQPRWSNILDSETLHLKNLCIKLFTFLNNNNFQGMCCTLQPSTLSWQQWWTRALMHSR